LNNTDYGKTPPTPARLATPLRPTTPLHEPYTPRTPSHDPFSASYIVPPTPHRPSSDEIHPSTPGGVRVKVQTPSHQYEPQTPFTPGGVGEWGNSAATPGGSWAAHTPRDSVQTPGGVVDNVQTPAPESHYTTPGGYGWGGEPVTPHPKTPLAPLTPTTSEPYGSISTTRNFTPTTPGSGYVRFHVSQPIRGHTHLCLLGPCHSSLSCRTTNPLRIRHYNWTGS